MTPRETDRYEAKARELYETADLLTKSRAVEAIAAALRAVKAETLERAAQALDSHRYINASKIVRALASPAAAPAAEKVRCMCPPGAVAGSCPLRNDVQSICECRCHAAPPPEPAAPSPDFFADHSDAEVQAALDDVRGKAPAQGAEARIAELEKERDHWRSACIEGMVTGKYPVSPHDDDPQIKSLREAAEASFHGQAYAEKARKLRDAEALLRECEEVLRAAKQADNAWFSGAIYDRLDRVSRKLAARAATPSTPGDGSAET